MTTFNQNDRVRITQQPECDRGGDSLVGLTGRVELVPPTQLGPDDPEDAVYFVPDDPSQVPAMDFYRAMFGDTNLPVQMADLELITDSEEDAA